jgi:hypothetical protein
VLAQYPREGGHVYLGVDGSGHRDYLTSWRARYIRHIDRDLGSHLNDLTFRAETTWKYPADNQGYWAEFWELDALE